ncbi:hypothetical protein PFISCL1PPCAC_27804 [Pristionchus fissidentatus]|uniref:Uncharacterized protein n=1 Tax=Pristionchus fissidentatus TaxID=1538716 RepID=A0AAV5X2V3_9BILA|nr:hypothetical protein PFISCL1PPCAC_27804 [Pristionchus fissidentatus]
MSLLGDVRPKKRAQPSIVYTHRRPSLPDSQWECLHDAQFVCDTWELKELQYAIRLGAAGTKMQLDREDQVIKLFLVRIARSAFSKLDFANASGIWPDKNHPPTDVDIEKKIADLMGPVTKPKEFEDDPKKLRKLDAVKQWERRNPKSERTPIPGRQPVKKRLVSAALEIAREKMSTHQPWFQARPSSPPVDIAITRQMAALDVAGNPSDSLKRHEEDRERKMKRRMMERKMWEERDKAREAEEERQENERLHRIEARRMATIKADMLAARGFPTSSRRRSQRETDEVFEMNL